MTRNATDPEFLHQAVSAAVQRLNDALATEAKLRSRLRRERWERRLLRRRAAHSVAQRAGDYTRAMRRFRRAIQVLFRKRLAG
jgi:hypothetical protein